MPISEKQLAANRANAAKSTGPRTQIGKITSSQNGQTHGLTAQSILMSPDESDAHDAFLAEYIDALKPEGLLELNLAQSIAEGMYRIRRAKNIENNIFALEQSGESDFEDAMAQAAAVLRDSSKIALLSLYEQRIHRTMTKDLATLRAMQTERKAAREVALRQAEILALASHAEGKSYDPSIDFPAENGFGFSNQEIAASIDRKRRLEAARILFSTKSANQKPLARAA